MVLLIIDTKLNHGHIPIYYIAMGNGPYIVDIPIKNCDFPVRKLLVYQRVTIVSSTNFHYVPWKITIKSP